MKRKKSLLFIRNPYLNQLLELVSSSLLTDFYRSAKTFIVICFCLHINIISAQNAIINNTTKSSDTPTFTKLFDFHGANNGSSPREIIKSGNFLYGVTFYGGSIGVNGILYKIKTNGTDFTNLGPALTNPNSLTILDTVLYGTMNDFYGDGQIYSVSVNGTDYKVIYSFSDNNLPVYNLTASENTIFGLKYGKFDGFSYFFRLNSDGSNFERFAQVGVFPYGKIIIGENYVYGTTAGPTGSTDNQGTVYKVKKDGTDYRRLHLFTDVEEGESPLASVTAIGQVLYGSTKEGGVNDCGIIFKINKDGTDFKILHHFASEEGYGIRAKLVFSGSSLYGAAYGGGNSDYGTLFKINLDGSGFYKLHDFQGTDGSRPVDLVLSGDTIFGITSKGGINDDGTIFRYVIDKPQVNPAGPPKVITLSISKPEEIILETKKGLIIENGNLIDRDTTLLIEGNISYTHSWNVKTGNDLQEINNKININQNSTFYVFVTTAQGCTYIDSVTVQVKNVTGIEDSFNSENQIKIYPNPNLGIFQIEISDGNANYKYDIFDTSGRAVANGNIFCKTIECISNIKLKDIKSGVYTLVIRKGDILYNQKKLVITNY